MQLHNINFFDVFASEYTTLFTICFPNLTKVYENVIFINLYLLMHVRSLSGNVSSSDDSTDEDVVNEKSRKRKKSQKGLTKKRKRPANSKSSEYDYYQGLTKYLRQIKCYLDLV